MSRTGRVSLSGVGKSLLLKQPCGASTNVHNEKHQRKAFFFLQQSDTQFFVPCFVLASRKSTTTTTTYVW